MRSTRLGSAVAACAMVAGGVLALHVMPGSPAAAAAPPFVEYTKAAPGPRGGVTIIGDSVMLGSVYETDGYGPSVAQMLVDRGWGPVYVKAGVGFQAGLNVRSNPGANMSKFVQDKQAQGIETPVYMVGIGPNDILGCSSNQACAEQDILGLVDTIGPGHEIWWSLITMTNQADADAWNNALAAVALIRPNLMLWDWPAARTANNIRPAADNIHLPTGAAYRARSQLMADDVTTRLGVSRQVGPDAALATAIGAPSEYQPLPLQRVYDSRNLPARVGAGEVVTIDLSARVPAGTSAVSVNLTAVGPALAGYLTAFPCGGAQPTTSNVNYLAGQIRPNHVVVGLGAGSLLCVFASTAGDVVVDLQGAFVADGLRLSPVAPTRLVDTRVSGRADPLVVTIPAGATAAVLNVTAVNSEGPGYVVVYPCDASPIPPTSNLNVVALEAVAGSVYAQVSAAGTVCVHANRPLDMIVDLQGTFSTGGALQFQAASPQRMVDTRTALGGWRGQVGVGQTIDLGVGPLAAQVVTGNITMIQPGTDGYATAYGCALATPVTSSVNAGRGVVAANSVTATVSPSAVSSELCIRASIGTHVIFDTTGWWIP